MAMADKMRSEAVSVMKAHKQLLSVASQSFPLMLDESISKNYTNVEQRIQKIANSNEYVGYLEIIATAFLHFCYKSSFTYIKQNDGCLSLVCKVP